MARRSGRASTDLTRLVLDTYGRVCHLGLPGCTRVATTKDHIIPYAAGGDDSLENFRPACRPCNSRRQDRAYGGSGARIKVVIGPPAGGKTTHITENAGPNDVMIDLDAIARALMPIQAAHTHVYPPHVRHVAIGARKAAIERSTRLRERVTVWIIQAIPSPDDLATYRAMKWEVITCDPGRDTVLQRCRKERPEYILPAVDRWYAMQAGTQAPALNEYDTEVQALKPGAIAPSRDW